MGEEHTGNSGDTARRNHRAWTANPSEQWSYALDHMDAGEFDLVVTHCERAISIWPTYYDAWLLLAGAHEENGHLNDAVSAAQRASEIAMDELGEAWNTLAALHILRGDYDDALTIDRILGLITPDRHAIICYRMSIAYTAQGDYENGKRKLFEAISSRDDFVERALAEPLLAPHHAFVQLFRSNVAPE